MHQQRAWLNAIAQVLGGGVTAGHFRPDIDPTQVAHDLNALMLGYHFSARLLRDPRAAERARESFDRLLSDIRA